MDSVLYRTYSFLLHKKTRGSSAGSREALPMHKKEQGEKNKIVR